MYAVTPRLSREWTIPQRRSTFRQSTSTSI
jgi:hypothetical protein